MAAWHAEFVYLQALNSDILPEHNHSAAPVFGDVNMPSFTDCVSENHLCFFVGSSIRPRTTLDLVSIQSNCDAIDQLHPSVIFASLLMSCAATYAAVRSLDSFDTHICAIDSKNAGFSEH